MAYNGSVELISGITPKNNQDFPLVDAKDVRVDDETRLDDALTGLKDDLELNGFNGYVASALGITDLNDAVKPGYYLLQFTANYVNDPIGPNTSKVLKVYAPASSNIVQEIYVYSEDCVCYVRTRVQGTWGNWTKVYDESVVNRLEQNSFPGYIASQLGITDLNNALNPGYYFLQFVAEYENDPIGPNTSKLLKVYAPPSGNIIQEIYAYNIECVCYVRTRVQGTWGSWVKVYDKNILNKVNENELYFSKGTVDNNTNLNSLITQGVYNISRNRTYVNYPYNSGTSSILYVYVLSTTLVYQAIVNIDDGSILTRSCINNVWNNWNGLGDDISDIRNELDTNVFNGYVASVLGITDLNNAVKPGYYLLQYTANYPNDPIGPNTSKVLKVYAPTKYGSNIVQEIYAYSIEFVWYVRTRVQGTWGSWVKVYDKNILNKVNPNQNYGYDTNIVSISHRGTRLTRPDSTSAAYINARQLGFKYVEGDLQRTLDGRYVIGHEDDIYDRTGIHKLISATNLSELKTIDFGGYLFENYSGQAILTLEEFLELCRNLGLTPVIDFKTKTSAQVTEIMSIIKKYGLPVYSINGSLDTILAVLSIDPNQFVRRSYDVYETTTENEINSILTSYPNAKLMIAYSTDPDKGWTDSVLESFINRGISVCPSEINGGPQFDNICGGKYYIHNIMCGGEFLPSKYAMTKDNNITIS